MGAVFLLRVQDDFTALNLGLEPPSLTQNTKYGSWLGLPALK